MKKQSILLVTPFARAEFNDEVSYVEGLSLLAAVAREINYDVIIRDFLFTKTNLNNAINTIVEINPAFLGISAISLNIEDAATLAIEVKKQLKDIVIIIGGVHVTCLPKDTMKKYDSFDIGIVGEGEETLKELLLALENEGSLKDINGIVYRKENEIVVNNFRAPIIDMDKLPFPAYDLYPNPVGYKQSVLLNEPPSAILITSRGCPGQCIYCGKKVFGNKLRAYSTKRLMEIINYFIENYNIRSVNFLDDNFVVFRKRLIEFCRILITKKYNLKWSCLSRVDNLDHNLLQLMKRAGCNHISFGIESGSQEILDFDKKNITLERVEKTVNLAYKTGIYTSGYFILGHPNEKKQTLEKTLEFTKKLPLGDIQISFMTLYPGTDIYNIANKYGVSDYDSELMKQDRISFIPYGLTEKYLKYYKKKILLSFYLKPATIKIHIKRAIKSKKTTSYLLNGLKYFKRFYYGDGY